MSTGKICEACGKEITRTQEPGSYAYVEAWVKIRAHKGGIHAVEDPKYVGRWLHSHCRKEMKLGGTPSMFDLS